MPHHHLEGLENEWTLVRETPTSQKYRVKTPDSFDFAMDVHYTPAKILTVNICFVGEKQRLTKSVLTPVMNDLGKIALRRTDYAVIDYTLCHADALFDGNFTVDPEWRRVCRETM